MRTVVYIASQVVQKHFMMVQKSSKGTGLLHVMEKNLFDTSPCKRKTAAANKKTKNMKQQ